MEIKKYWCKTEEVPVIAGYVLNSIRVDLADFQNFSSMYSEESITSVEAQKNVCSELIKSSAITGQLKLITQQLNEKANTLRISLNPLEGYLILACKELDIQIADFELKGIRKNIAGGNMEGVIQDVTTLVSNLKRNATALTKVGMKAQMPDDLQAISANISVLNEAQHLKESERSRMLDSNLKEFNKMWEMITMITKSARAMYRGVDNVKLKDYTISNLIKKAKNTNNNDPHKPSDPNNPSDSSPLPNV